MVFYGILKTVSKKFDERVKGMLKKFKVFQGSFKDVLRKIQGC